MLILAIFLFISISNAEYGLNNIESNELLLPSRIEIEKAVSALASTESKETNNNVHLNGGRKCEEITVPMCRNMEYNMTSMPNQFNHENQQEAAAEAHQFWALVEINCAKELRFFLCSMYTPICLPNYPQPVKACRSVCVRARIGCEKYMKKFGFDWPEHMNCDLFPEYGSSKEVCMDPIDAEEQQHRKKLTLNHNLNSETIESQINFNSIKSSKSPAFKINSIVNKEENNENRNVEIKTNDIIKYELFNKNRDVELVNKMCEIPFLKVNDVKDTRYGKFSTAGLKNCIQPCHSIYFTPSERQFTYYWLILWSLLCLFSSFCTTCTYLIESSRFKYPEKPIIYLSICYLFVSIGYMFRFISGHEQMACELDGSIKYSNMKPFQSSSSSLGSISCILTFILTYYFGMASSVWWVIVSLTWFLAAGLKWGTEAISRYSVYFHLFAWLLPFIQTVIILSLSLIDADSLTGICYVGNLNSHNLRLFVILPATVYLSIGITFLIAGFISLIRIRNLIKKQHTDLRKAHKLEKLMIRIGIFSILYTVPATCVIACQFYEQYYRNDWERNLLCKNKKIKNKIFQQYIDENYGLIEDFCSNKISENNFGEQPEFSIFMIKYFMSLIVGVTSGFWIWTGKSLQSWKKFFIRIFYSRQCESPREDADDNQASSSDSSGSEPSCFLLIKNIFSSKKRVCRLQKDSIVYFQANDEIEHNPLPFYDIAAINKLNNNNHNHNTINNNKQNIFNKFDLQQKQMAQIIYKQPESVVSLQFNNINNNILSNTTNTISTTSSNGHHNNQFFTNQYKLLPTNNNNINNCHTNKAAAFIYDYTSTLYRNDKGTINTTSTTNGSSIPSTLSVLNK